MNKLNSLRIIFIAVQLPFFVILLLLSNILDAFGIIQVVKIALRIDEARIPVRHHVVLTIVDAEFELLSCADHDVRFETSQLSVVLAWNEHAPWHFRREFAKYVNY